MSVFLDGDLYIYILYFFSKQFRCFCCFFSKFFEKKTRTGADSSTNPSSPFPWPPGPTACFIIRRWIPHNWPPKRVACRGVQVV